MIQTATPTNNPHASGITSLQCPFRILLLLIISTVLFNYAGITQKTDVAGRYNVLLIMADDMNTRLSFMGYPEVPAPNLQRLVNRGMVFNKAYCQFPLCNPSRTSMLTGVRPDNTKVYSNEQRPKNILDPGQMFFPEYFKSKGYRIERYGKIMHGKFEDDITWDYAESGDTSYEPFPAIFSNDTVWVTSESPEGEWWVTNLHDTLIKDYNFADHLATRMKINDNVPFLYALGLTSTHNPFSPPVKYWNKTGDSSVQELLPNSANGDYNLMLTGNGSSGMVLPETPIDDIADIPNVAIGNKELIQKKLPEWKKTIHAYNAEAILVDAQLGLVLDELDRQQLWDNTIVIFVSDHGQHLGEHGGLWGKITLFEESLRVPFIICAPGIQPGTCDRITELVDIFPTLLELCRLPPVQGLEGTSVVPLLTQPDLPWKKAAFSQLMRNRSTPYKSIATEKYRYTNWDTAGEELYDHRTDPREYTNLALNPQYADVLEQMRNMLSAGWPNAAPPACIGEIYFRDKDEDGFGTPADSVTACYLPIGYAANDNDCDDNNEQINPLAPEICGNGIDDNCNGLVDESNLSAVITASGSTDICSTGAVTLYTTKVAGYRYQWRKDNHNIPGARKWKYTATTPGTYRVGIMDSSSCTVLSKSIRVTAENCITASAGLSGIDLKNTASMPGVFPNPSTGLVTLRFNSIINGPAQIRVTDMAGKSINASTVTVTKGVNTHQLNLSQLANGVYFIEAQSGKEHCRFTCIIAK